MDFMTIGKVNSYIRQKNLSFAANYKIKTGQRVTNANGGLSFSQSSMFAQINKSTKKVSDEVKAARLKSIKQKLMNGKKLSDEEMGFLLKNDSELYKKAKHADDAREELKTELKGAKTKQEAHQILNRAMVKASAEASAEIAACKAGVVTGGNMSMTTGDVSISIATENISSGGEISTSTENISSVNEPSTTENNSNVNEKFTKNENTLNVNENSNEDNVNNSVQSVLEKFIMTIRAIEDEWASYSNSDEYKNLPEDYFEDEQIYKVAEVPNRKLMNAIFTYRKAQSTSKNF